MRTSISLVVIGDVGLIGKDSGKRNEGFLGNPCHKQINKMLKYISHIMKKFTDVKCRLSRVFLQRLSVEVIMKPAVIFCRSLGQARNIQKCACVCAFLCVYM